MKNVIKAQIYQILRQRKIWIILAAAVIFLVFQTLNYFGSVSEGNESLMINTSNYMNFVFPTNIWITEIIISIVVGYICAADFTDKTYTTDVMSGIRRIESYAGRVVVSFMMSAIAELLILLAPVIWITLIYGWGDVIPPSEIVKRMALELCIFVRVTSLIILASYIIKNYIGVVVFMLILDFAELSIISFSNDLTSSLFVFVDLQIASMMISNTIYDIDGTVHEFYNSYLTESQIIKLIVSSFTFSIIYLVTGCFWYRCDDME